MTDQCVELQNIQYQTMLLNNNNTVISTIQDSDNIEHFLNHEKENSYYKPWNKLGNHIKLKILTQYIETLSEERNYTNEQQKELLQYIKTCIQRKKLSKIKDVNYDKEKGIINNIPNLIFDKTRHKFTLKIMEKKKSSLKSLAPPRRNKTNKLIILNKQCDKDKHK
jgi:hypothetical protein